VSSVISSFRPRLGHGELLTNQSLVREDLGRTPPPGEDPAIIGAKTFGRPGRSNRLSTAKANAALAGKGTATIASTVAGHPLAYRRRSGSASVFEANLHV
jgi:hypothetical protein